MIEKTDWDAAYRKLIAAHRSAQGETPGEDDLVAYALGELSSEEAARIEQELAADPDLLRLLRETFPDGPRPGDPAPLTPQEKEEDWAKIQARLAGEEPAREQAAPPPVVLPAVAPPQTPAVRAFPPPLQRQRGRQRGHLLTAAALLAIAFGGLYFRMWNEVQRLSQPRVLEHQILLPDGVRGAKQPAILLPSTPGDFLLAPSLIAQPDFPEYRLDILKGTGEDTTRIWSVSGLQRQSDDTIEIWVPRTFLKSGPYQLRVYGRGAGGESLLATYTVQLAD